MPAARVKMRIQSSEIAALAGKLAQIDRKAARKGLRAGVNEVTKEVMWEAKSLVPKRTGLLRRSIGRKVKVYKGGAIITGIIGPRKGFRTVLNGQPIDPVKYAHLVEFGRREVRPKKKKVLAGSGVPLTKKPVMGPFRQVVYGVRVKSVPPRPFMRPAWEKYERQAVQIILWHLRKALRDLLMKGRSGRSKRAA